MLRLYPFHTYLSHEAAMTPQSDSLPGNQPTLKPTRVARAILAYLP